MLFLNFLTKLKNYIIYKISVDRVKMQDFVFKGKKNLLKKHIASNYNFKGDLLNYFVNNKTFAVHKWHHYIPIYDKYFSRFRNTKVRFLEIGVKKGGSLKLWRKYFGKKAVIYGIDIDPECLKLNFRREHIRIGDQSDPNFLKKIKKEMKEIDIILDDGSHRQDHIKKSLLTLFPHLNNNGIYVIEDLHSAYLSGYQGGFGKKNNFFNSIRNLIDDMHFQYHLKKLYFPQFKKQCFSIHIYDSIVIIEKRKHIKAVHSKIY